MTCPLCDRISATATGAYPYLIHEYPHSYLYLGEHQFYRGYCVLVTKTHYKEMTDVPESTRAALFHEMMHAHALIEAVFAPKKMNLCSLGNVVAHIHWHFFPRYAEDPNFTNPPWLQMHLFDEARVPAEERNLLIEKIKAAVTSL
jgi:diadenosine tetraphosphate (Ap4A) HIT family hydrolase